MPERPNEFELLCEGCGYPLEGLVETGGEGGKGECPECGRAVAMSAPSRRAGSPWQRGPYWRSWLATNIGTLAHPAARFAVLRLERWRSNQLLRLNLAVASFLLSLDLVELLSVMNGWRHAWPDLVVPAAITTPFWMVVLIILTSIEAGGIRFFGSRRGWRIDRIASSAICGHASVGWIVSGLLAGVGVMVGAAVKGPSWTFYTPYSTTVSSGDPPLLLILPTVGFAIGLLTFEVLVYIGVRRCRFANRIRQGAEGVEQRPEVG